MKILAGIITYNPDIERLNENISLIEGQVDLIVIIDNCSKSRDFINLIKDKNVVIIKNDSNYGVAFGLNQIFDFAIRNQFDWVLTLDQDSVVTSTLINEYRKYLFLPNIGVLTCNIIDRNFKTIIDDSFVVKKIPSCITSGSFCSVYAFIKSGGFDETFFIDCVDFDFCYALRIAGYYVYQINFNGLLHEVGHAKAHKLFHKSVIVYNEKPIRHYYMARNYIFLAKKYPSFISKKKAFCFEIKQLFLLCIFEKNKITKLNYRIRGIRDGIKGRNGLYRD